MTRYCSLRFTHLSGLMAPFWKDISEAAALLLEFPLPGKKKSLGINDFRLTMWGDIF